MLKSQLRECKETIRANRDRDYRGRRHGLQRQFCSRMHSEQAYQKVIPLFVTVPTCHEYCFFNQEMKLGMNVFISDMRRNNVIYRDNLPYGEVINSQHLAITDSENELSRPKLDLAIGMLVSAAIGKPNATSTQKDGVCVGKVHLCCCICLLECALPIVEVGNIMFPTVFVYWSLHLQ